MNSLPLSTRMVVGYPTCRPDPLQCLNDILPLVTEAGIDCRREARVSVDDREHPQFLAGRQLVVNEAHGPDIVRSNGHLPIFPQLGFDSSLRRLVTQLQAKSL